MLQSAELSRVVTLLKQPAFLKIRGIKSLDVSSCSEYYTVNVCAYALFKTHNCVRGCLALVARIGKIMITLSSCNGNGGKAGAPVPQLFTADIYGYHYPNGDASGWLPELEVK